MELVGNGLRVNAPAREAGWIEHFGNVAAAVVCSRTDCTREGARRAAVERGIGHDVETSHDGAHLRIVPALVVVLREAELAVHDGDRGQEVEAVIGGLPRLWIDAAGIVLLAPQ